MNNLPSCCLSIEPDFFKNLEREIGVKFSEKPAIFMSNEEIIRRRSGGNELEPASEVRFHVRSGVEFISAEIKSNYDADLVRRAID